MENKQIIRKSKNGKQHITNMPKVDRIYKGKTKVYDRTNLEFKDGFVLVLRTGER